MARKLNQRQLTYCYYRAREHTIEESMIKAGYKGIGEVARAVGSRLETNANIQIQIETERANVFDKSKITDEYILKGLSEIAKNGKQEANRVRAWELLGKTLAMFTERTEIKGDMTLSPTQEKKIEEYITNRLNGNTN